jgi:hypothetical protein
MICYKSTTRFGKIQYQFSTNNREFIKNLLDNYKYSFQFIFNCLSEGGEAGEIIQIIMAHIEFDGLAILAIQDWEVYLRLNNVEIK